MKQIASEKEAKLIYLKRELVRRISRSKFFNSDCHYTAPKSKMPMGVKRLLSDIEALQEEIKKCPK